MRIHHEQLRAKGWTHEEIARTRRAFENVVRKRHPAHRFLERATFWGLLALTLIATFLASVFLWPASLLPTSVFSLILMMAGLAFGALYAVVVRILEFPRRGHHLAALVLIAIVAFASAYTVVGRLSAMERAAGLGAGHDPMLLGFLYAFAVILPTMAKLTMDGVACR